MNKKYFCLFVHEERGTISPRLEIVFPKKYFWDIIEFGKVITLGRFREVIYSYNVLYFEDRKIADAFATILKSFGWVSCKDISDFFDILDKEEN